MSMRSLRLAKLAAGALCFLPPASMAQSPKPLRFVMDWAAQGPQAIFLTPEGQQCYGKAGLAVTTDRGYGSGDTITKVGAGTYDVGFADLNAMIEYNARNPGSKEVAIFVIYDGSPLSIVTLKENKIEKPADLVGRTVSAPPGDASRRLLPLLASANGFDASTVKLNNVSPEVRESLLARRGTDAIAGAAFTAFMGVRGAQVPADQIVVMRYSSFGVDLFGSSLVVRKDFAEANAEALKAFVGCVVVGIKTAMADPKGAIAALKKVDPLTIDTVETERMKLSYDWSIVTDSVKRNGLSFVDPERLKRTSKQVADAFGVPVPASEDVFVDRFLPAKGELALPKAAWN